jgi:hypothetical protein
MVSVVFVLVNVCQCALGLWGNRTFETLTFLWLLVLFLFLRVFFVVLVNFCWCQQTEFEKFNPNKKYKLFCGCWIVFYFYVFFLLCW